MIDETPRELSKLFQYLWALLRNPLKEIKNLPSIQWPTLVAFQFCLSLSSALIATLLAPFKITVIHLIASLVAALLATGLVSLFFYYFFLLVFERTLPFIRIFTLVLFAHIPFAIFHLATYFFPPADLIGLAISAMLMVVGLVENFRIPKRLAIRLMISCYAVFFVYWSIELITVRHQFRQSSPQSLDKMEEDMQRTFQ